MKKPVNQSKTVKQHHRGKRIRNTTLYSDTTKENINTTTRQVAYSQDDEPNIHEQKKELR